MSYSSSSNKPHLPLFLIATILLTTLLTSLKCTTDVSKTNASSSDPNNAAANPSQMENKQPNSAAETAGSQLSSPNKTAANPSPKSPPAGWNQMKLKRIRNSTDAKILGDLGAVLAGNSDENTDEGSENLLGKQPPMASKSAPKKEEVEKNEARDHDKSLAENVQETAGINAVDGNEKEISSNLSNKHLETKGKQQQQQEGSDSSGSPLTIPDGTKISSWKRNLKVDVGKLRGHQQQKQQQEADDNRGGNGEIEIVPLPPHSTGHSPAHLSAKSRNHEIVVAETGRHLTKYLSRQHTRTGKSGPLMTPEMTKKESNKFNNNNNYSSNNSFNSSPQSSLQILPLASQGMGHWKVAKSLVSSSVEAGRKVFSKLRKRWRAPAGKNAYGKESSIVEEVHRNFEGGQEEEEDEEDTTEWHEGLRRQRNNNDALGREEVLPEQFQAHSHSPPESSNSGGILDGKRTDDETSDDEDLKFFTPKGNSVKSVDDDELGHHEDEEGSVSKNDLQTHLKQHSSSTGGGSVVNGSGNGNELISDDDIDDGDAGSFHTPKGSENGVVFEGYHQEDKKGTQKKSSSLSSSLPSGNRSSGEEGDEEDEEQLIVRRRSDHFHSSGNNSAKINSWKRDLNVGNVREHHQQQQGSEGGNNDDDEIVSSSTGHSTGHSPEGSNHRNNNANEIVEEVETEPKAASRLHNSVQQHQQNTSKSGLITTADHHHYNHHQNEKQKGKSSNGKQSPPSIWATIRGTARKMSKATKFSKAIKFCKGSCFTDHNNNNDDANKKILTSDSEKVVFSKLPSQHGHQQHTKVMVAMEEGQKRDVVRKLPSTIDRLFPVSPPKLQKQKSKPKHHLQVVEDQKERIVAANKEEDI